MWQGEQSANWRSRIWSLFQSSSSTFANDDLPNWTCLDAHNRNKAELPHRRPSTPPILIPILSCRNKLGFGQVNLTRRQFAIGFGAFSSSALLYARFGIGEPAPFSTPLPIPKLIDAAKQGNAVKLKVMSGRHAFVKGKPTRTYGYSAPILGPVIRLRRGDEVEMTVENALDFVTTVHWHGLLVPGYNDGGPQQLIHPGDSWRPVLKIDQAAATLWFHPHPHHDTARQIYMGLAGMIIVDDGSDARLGLPRTFGVDDLPIILQDRSFGSDGSIEYDNNDLNPLDVIYGARGETIIVNGAIAPFAKVPPGLVRLRLLNAANAQNFELRFSDRRTFYVIASDGGFLSAPVAVTQLTISPAERFEVLVDFADGKAVALETGPDEEMGVFGRVAPDGSADYVAVMRFEPTATTPIVNELPTRLVEPCGCLSGIGRTAPAIHSEQRLMRKPPGRWRA